MKNISTILLTLFAFTINIFAVPANPNLVEVDQPDGTQIKIKVQGDEFHNWYEDEDGYTIIQDEKTKEWSYAQENNLGELKTSSDIVGKVKPELKGITKHLKDRYKSNDAKLKRKEFNSNLIKNLKKKELVKVTKSNIKLTSLQDNIKEDVNISKAPGSAETKVNFVLLIQFKDVKFKDNPPFNSSTTDEQVIQTFSNLFNKENYSDYGAFGSVKDYFKEVSYGKLEYNSVISPVIVTAPNDHSYYGVKHGDVISVTRIETMIKDALDQIDDVVDFKAIWPSSSNPQGFTVIHAGGGAESGNHNFIWSHYNNDPLKNVVHDGIKFLNYHIEPAGRGYNGDKGITRIGVICHESMHFFNIPDLYDTTGASEGIGNFCLMAGGNWNGPLDDGVCPAHPCVWIKNKLGWITLQTASTGINYINSSAQNEDGFYKFVGEGFDTKEYFLMENRQSYGFDSYLPGSTRGLLIYHIDENMTDNDDYKHYMVDIEEADGTSNWKQDHLARKRNSGLDRDYFRNSTVNYFYDDCVSSPNSRSYDNIASNIKISAISKSSQVMSFVYGKDIIIIDDLSNVVAFPNPARKGYMYFTNLPSDVSDFGLEIYTILGQFVKKFTKDDIDSITGVNRIKWECKNENGQNVAPGVYIALIKSGSTKKKMKVAVIR